MSGKYTKSGIPHGFTSITLFIVIKNLPEVIEFYKAVLMKGLRVLLNLLMVDQVFENAVARGANIREPIANFVSSDQFVSIL